MAYSQKSLLNFVISLAIKTFDSGEKAWDVVRNFQIRNPESCVWVEFVVGPCLALFFCRFAFLFPTTKTLQFPIWPQSMSTSSWKISESIMITLHFTLPVCFTHNISYSMGTCVTTVTPRFKLTVESSYKVSALQHVHENHRNHWTFFLIAEQLP